MIYTVTFNPAIDYVVRLDAPLEVGEVNRAKGEDCGKLLEQLARASITRHAKPKAEVKMFLSPDSSL